MLLVARSPLTTNMPLGNHLVTPKKSNKRSWHDANEGASDSPWRNALDSPSAQLLRELGLQRSASDRELQLQLDKRMSDLEKQHLLHLNLSAEEHDRVFQRAKLAHERAQLEFERRRREQEEEEQLDLERRKREHVELQLAEQQRRTEEARQLEERKRTVEKEARKAEEEAIERERRHQQEDEQRQKGFRERDERTARRRSRDEQPAPGAQDSYTPPSNCSKTTQSLDSSQDQQNHSDITSTITQRDFDHEKYLEIHTRLKAMRRMVLEKCKGDKQLKTQVGDWRREIRKKVGQLTLTDNKQAIQGHLRKVREILSAAAQVPQPTVDIRQFLALPPTQPDASDGNSHYPAVLLYELNIFAKRLVGQFADECSAVTKLAEPIGILAISIFAAKDFKWLGEVSLVDLLLAKLHFCCPILFGVYGSERTDAGRDRLGWQRDKERESEKNKRVWMPDQKHYERMTGLSAGFAALSLRDFSRTATKNPLPSNYFWCALARITNTPPQKITQTHLVVLKALVENNVVKFRSFYGSAATAALRRAVVEFPAMAPDGPGKSAIGTLPMLFKRDHGLKL